MNMKMLTISSLILVTGFVNCAEKETVDMSLIDTIKIQAKKYYYPITGNDYNIALEKLYQTEKGRIYTQELDLYNKSRTFKTKLLKAEKNLHATENYNEFLSMQKKYC